MNRIANTCLAALASALCAQAAAQGMYKCQDAAGKITYAGQECDKLGLRSAGEVKGRASVSPAPAFQPPPPVVVPPPGDAAEKAAPPSEPPAKEREVEVGKDGRRCFTVKTAKGTATRCNDASDGGDKAD